MAKYDADALFQELDRRNSADFAPPPVAYTPPRLPGETPPVGKYNTDALFQELDRRNSTTSMWEPVQMAINSASYGDGVAQAKLDKTRFDLNKWVGEQAIPVNKYTHAEAQRQLQRAQMDHILRDSPHTARWFTEQVQQGKTPYDVGTLANIERVTRVAPLLAPAFVGEAYKAIGGTTAVPGAFFDVVGQALEPVFGKLPKSELTNIGQLLTAYGEKVAGEVPRDLNIVEKGAVSAAGSLGAFATALPMAVFGLPGVLGAMSVGVGGSTYLENLKTTGNSATAMFHGILDAGYEYLLEKAGGTGLLFDKAAWSKGFLSFLAKFEAKELATELPTTFFQKANQYILQNPERTFEQFMAELPEDLAVTAIATLFSAKGQAIAFKAVDKLADLGNTTAKAQAAHDNLTALLDNVAKSELYLNDPDTFAQFFQGVARDTTVTVDPVKLVEAMTAANVSEEALPSLKDQLNAPGEIELTVQELATAFAGTGAETTLLQHVRPEPDLPTLAESKEQTKAAFEAFQEAGEKALARFQADEVFNENLKAVKEEVVADILHTGRAGKHYAEGYGTLMAHFYATMAKAHGVTPLQIRDGWTDANGVEHRGYNPRVVGPTGQVRRRTPATTVDFKRGRVANLMNRDNWAVLEAGNPNGTEATPEENAVSMAKLKAYLDKEGIEYHDAKGSYFGTKADSLMLLGVTAERASEIGNMFGQESISTRHGLVFGDGTVAQATGVKEVKDTEAEDHTFLPAFGSAFRLEIPESAFENRVKLNEVLNQTRPAGQRARATVFSALADANTMANAVAVAKSQAWQTGRDLKLALDSKVRELAKAKKIDPASPSEDGRAYLVQMLVSEASLALEKDTRAVGWYADRVTRALNILSLIHPELNTDQNARFTFIWALAVTSNGLRVNKNFELAEIAYRRYKAEGKMPTDVGIGAAAAKINEGLGVYNTITESLGMEKAIEFMNTRMTVRDLKTLTGKKIFGEGMDTEVLGAAVLGPKIGNGFFANLYGHFDQLTMDRWFVRTWGRWTGTLVRIPTKAEVDASSAKLKGLVGMLSKYEKAEFEKAFGEKLRVSDMPALAQAIADITTKPEPREAMRLVGLRESSAFEELLGPAKSNQKRVSVGDEIRKLAIGLTRLIDGQKEEPGGSKERDYMRAVYAEGLAALQEEYPELTMSDLQAVMWYPEKQLYETAKLRDENSQKEYEDDEVPDYATAAVNLAKQKGVKVPRELATDQRPAVVRRTKPAAASFQQTGGRQGAQKPAGLTITGVHFSPSELTELLPSKYGKGLEGAERARVMASKDARIKRRTHFYVNTGQGVFPEAGMGGKAHVSELANLYDADVDALGLFKGKTDEQLNAAESAVLDAGYSGYVMRGFGNQGAAVVFGATVGDPGKPDAKALRPVVVTGTDLMGDGRGFTEFFSEASKGNRAPEEPYKPVLDIGKISEFSEEYVKHRGNFDDHIASSIPGFREVQQIVGDAIVKTFPKGAVLLDLGASEGAFGKAITAVSGGGVKTLSLDPNLEMANFFSEHSRVPGADYVVAALGSAEDAGTTAWTEGETPIPFFAPTQAYDVVHEAMVFQFISNGRNAQVARVKEMLKPGGVAFFEEKTADDSPEFVANEAQKDAYKNQFFSKRQIAEKNKEVLARGAEVVAEEEKKREQNTVGMNDLMTTRKELEAVLLRNFKHVVQYWDSGNFAGYMASDDPKMLKKLEGNMLPTSSEFAAVDTPRKVASPQPMAPRERGIPTKFVGGKEEASVPVAPAAQYSETQRLRQALTTSKDLPHGAMTAAKWREHIGKVLPDLLPKIEASGALERVQGMVYRDELARAIEPPEGQFYQSGWYSPLTRAFQNVKQAAMPGSQWASWLAGNKAKLGLKDDEIQWSGLNEYLELRGKDKVTREEIVDYLLGNGVKVEETVLGGAQGITEKDLDNAEVEARRTGDWAAYEDLTRRYEDEQVGNNANGSGNKTLYASYVPPGGIPGTYVEILETLPERGRAEFERIRVKVDNDEPLTPEENEVYGTYEPGVDTYRSSHWPDTPNVLVHLRVDEAEDAGGRRVLRVIEVQSDWGQKGKKEGFAQAGWPDGYEPVEVDDPYSKEPFWTYKYDDFVWGSTSAQGRGTLEEARVRAWQHANGGKRVDTPSAPFVTDTKAWVALGIKRAIMHAMDVGADGVVFGTGQQNVDLYDLSKTLQKVAAMTSDEGATFKIMGTDLNGNGHDFGTHPVGKLDDVVGKELAEKIASQKTPNEVYAGNNLKVGGEGMKTFYDKIVPQVANDVLKKLGAGVKVEKVTVPTPVDEATTDRALVMDEDVEHFGFSITPEFRAKVMEGVPLFQVKPAYAVRSPEGAYQGIRELTDKEARELIDLGYRINRVTPGYGQAENAMGGFNPRTMEITLLANSNLSTFLHETGHFFLTVYADMAAQEGAPQQIVDDMNAVLKWFGIGANPGGWNAMSVDQQRPYHEQFAESFEQYLFSGKAPTKELQSLFQRFAKWLTRVYGSIKEFVAGHPGAKIDPEMVAVMDRMLATETEIAVAEDNRNYEALFRTAAEAGMTPAQFAAYLDLPEEARVQAEERLRARSMRDMKWLQNRRNRTIAALQKEAAAARAEVRKEVAETVAQEPIFRALRWLKRGELTNPDTGEEVKAIAGNKLSIPALEGMYPEGALGDKPDWRSLGYGQYGMLANEGQHPDIAADMFGFDSGAALVDALVNAPKFKDEVEGRTDQIMLERHGDLSSPDKIAQAADEAIHNEVRTKLVATELSFLDKLTGSPSFLIKAAKEYARQLVANRTSKTLKAWVFAADEVRASKAAAAALKKGDTKAAANHKRVELLNHAAVREAHAAEKELKKIVDRLRKIASYKDDDSSAKARDMDVVNAVRVVLYRFGLGTERKGKAATEYLSLVETNDPAMGAALRDLVDSTTDNAKDWRDLKLSELRDLHDAVEAVWTLAKRSRQMEVDGELVPRRQIEQELYDRLDEIGIPDTMPGETSAVTESERNWMKFSTFVAALRRVESWVEAKDGKAMGPFRKYIWSQIKDAAGTYRVKKAEYLKAYRELLDTIAPTLKRELIDAREIGYTFGKGEGGMGMVELLHAILHTGNASNKRKLLLGRGWATDNGDGTLDTSKWDAFVARMIQEGKLTKAHYDFAQGVWDLLDSTKVDAQKAHRSVFGRYFAEVTADAFTTPFGDYRGGYVPAQADPEIVQDAQLKELANQENENMVYAFPSTPKGFTKSRVEYNRPLRLDLRSLAGHIDKVLLFSYLTEPVSDVRRVILSKTVSQALGRVDPKAIGVMLTPWLNRVAKQIVEDRVPGREPLARFWSVARARAGMSAMFANLANSVQQITGISLAAVKVRPKYLLEAMAHGTMSPRKLAAHVAAMSPYMRDRMHNDVVLMGEAIDEILLNPGVYESAKAWSAKHAYFMQRAVDNYLSPMIWMGAFNQAKENGSDDLEARRLADSAVRETQGSQAPEDIAAFEQGTAFYRMFVQFAGYFNMNANLLGTEFVKISRDMGLKKGAGRGLYVLALGFYVPAVLGELIIQAFRGGPDDDDKDGEYLDDWLAAVFGYGPARYLTAMAPVVGQAANALFNTLNNKPYDDRISTAPAISMIESAVKAPISVYKAIADEGKSTKAVNDTATLISMTVGVPARAVAKPISYLTGVANEEIEPEDTYDAIRGTITGTASPGSKQ